jgi:hypothetical protein
MTGDFTWGEKKQAADRGQREDCRLEILGILDSGYWILDSG